MTIELIESTKVYNVTHNEKEYTVSVFEDKAYYKYQVIDSEGTVISDEFVDEFMDTFLDYCCKANRYF
jgi:hypothetical protein